MTDSFISQHRLSRRGFLKTTAAAAGLFLICRGKRPGPPRRGAFLKLGGNPPVPRRGGGLFK